MQFSKTSPTKSLEKAAKNPVEKIASNPVTSVAVMIFLVPDSMEPKVQLVARVRLQPVLLS